MAAERYPVGTVFVQVAPSFHSFFRELGRQARDMDAAVADEMGKSDTLEREMEKKGRSAGKRAMSAMRDEARKGGDDVGKDFSSSVAKAIRRGAGDTHREIEKLLKSSNDLTRTQSDNLKRLSRTARDLSKETARSDDDMRRMLKTTREIDRQLDDMQRAASTRDMFSLGDARNQLDQISRAHKSALSKMEREEAAHTQRIRKEAAERVKAEKAAITERARAEKDAQVERERAEKAHFASLAKYQRDAVRQVQRAIEEIGNSNDEQLQRLKRSMEKTVIRLKVDDAPIQRVQSELAALKQEAGDVRVRVDVDGAQRATAAFTQLDRAQAAIEKRVDVEVKARGVARTLAELKAIEKENRNINLSSRDSANAFRAFNGVLLAAVTIGPALVPVLAAVSGGLVALTGSAAGAGAGIGVLLLAFKGIGDAVGALQKAEDVGVTSAKTIERAARGVEDATRNLARARRDAAQSIADAEDNVADAVENAADRQRAADEGVVDARRRASDLMQQALDRQRTAEERLIDAKRNARQAEIALADARRQAALDQINLQFQLEQGRLDKSQSRIDVFEAQISYNAVMADGSSTNLEKEQARIQLEQAKLRARQIDQTNKQLAREKKKSDKQGIEGSDRVRDAQDALTQALKDQRDAQKEVRQAAKETARAQREGAKLVSDAIREQTEVQRDNIEAIRDAQEQLRRTQVSAAESVGDAQRNLTRQQEDYRDAVRQTSAAADDVAVAMGKLSPAGRDFAEYIFGLRGYFRELQGIAQTGILPNLQTAMQQLGGVYGQGLKAFVGAVSNVMGDLALEASDVLRGGVMREFFSVFADATPTFTKLFGQTTLNWMQIFARFLTLAEPTAMALSRALKRISENILEWTKSARGTRQIEGFFAYVRKVGPEVEAMFFELGRALANIGRALAPVGEAVINAMTGFFRWIANMDPGRLRIILVTLIGLVTAFQLLTGATALVAGISAAGQSLVFLGNAARIAAAGIGFLLSPAGLVVLAVLAIGAALVWAYFKFDWFRKAVNKVWAAYSTAVQWYWNHIVKPVFTAWWMLLQWSWKNVFGPIFGLLGKVFAAVGVAIWNTWTKRIGPTFKVFWELLKFLWDKVARPIFGWIGNRFESLGKGMQRVWTDVIQPVFQAFRDWLKGDGFLQKAIRAGVGAIKAVWDTLIATFASPAEFVLKYVVNEGIIGGLRWLGKKLGMDEKELPQKITIPKLIAQHGAFASGGIPDARKLNIYPGYTPGRDTGHVIGIGGGEAIMRPEWTRVMGRDFVEGANAAARRGGVNEVRRFMGGLYGGAYASGGIALGGRKRWWPVPGHQTSTYAGHDGVDINRGSGWDDFGDPIRAAAPGRVAYVGSGRGYGDAIFVNGDYGTLVYGHTSSQAVRAGQLVAGGQLLGRVGNTGNSSAPHLHFGFPGGSYSQAMAFLAGASVFGGKFPTGSGKGETSLLAQIGGFVKKIGKGLWNIISSPVEFLTKRIHWDKLKETAFEKGSFVFDLLKGVGRKVIDMGVGWIKDKIDLFSEEGGPKDNMGLVDDLVSQSQKRNREIVQSVAATYGWAKGGQWNALQSLISKESSWNNLAQNPTSSAFGLFQFLDSTWRGTGTKKTGDAQKQAIAGLRYIDERYGSPVAAWRFHQSHNWYSDGGVVPGGTESAQGDAQGAATSTMMYDNGGYLPTGITQVVNMTGRPEPVFTSRQWDDIRRGGGSGGGDHIDIDFNGRWTDPDEVIDAVMHAYRLKKLGGVHG